MYVALVASRAISPVLQVVAESHEPPSRVTIGLMGTPCLGDPRDPFGAYLRAPVEGAPIHPGINSGPPWSPHDSPGRGLEHGSRKLASCKPVGVYSVDPQGR